MILLYLSYTLALKPDQVNPHIWVKWTIWVTELNHRKLDNLVYIFKMVTVDSECWSTSDCHGIASEYNLVLLVFLKQYCW